MSEFKNGKKSIKSKPEPIIGRILGGGNDVPPAIRKYCENNGLEMRWLSSNLIQRGQGIHPRRWQVFKLGKDNVTIEQLGPLYGVDPEGIVRNRDLVLGVRSTELGKQHRKELREATERQENAVKGQASQLKRMMAQSGFNTEVTDSYED